MRKIGISRAAAAAARARPPARISALPSSATASLARRSAHTSPRAIARLSCASLISAAGMPMRTASAASSAPSGVKPRGSTLGPVERSSCAAPARRSPSCPGARSPQQVAPSPGALATLAPRVPHSPNALARRSAWLAYAAIRAVARPATTAATLPGAAASAALTSSRSASECGAALRSAAAAACIRAARAGAAD